MRISKCVLFIVVVNRNANLKNINTGTDKIWSSV